MKIKLVDKNTYRSEDGRVVIRKVLEEHVYYRGSHRKTARKPDVIYDIYVDGCKLHYSEYQFRDAKEMAVKKIKEIDNAKKKEGETQGVQCSGVGASIASPGAHGGEKSSDLSGSDTGKSI
jgi:hypothetical protein